MRKIAINLHAKRGMDTESYIKKMREVGFNALFTSTPSEEELRVIVNALSSNGLSYEMIHAPFQNTNAIWQEGEDGKHELASLITAVRRAAQANCPTVAVHLTASREIPPITDLGRARYEILAEYAAKKNVNIAFENIIGTAHLEWAMKQFKNAPNVGFCWDCGHEKCFAEGTEYMPLFGDRLIATHLHDNDGIAGNDQHKLPFDGKLDFGRVVKQLRQSGYQGTLTVEAFAENTSAYDLMTPAAFLERAAMVAKRIRLMVDGF